MKDINAVLAQKLEELKRCRIDLYCLKGTIRLLTEPEDVRGRWLEGTITANEARQQLGLQPLSPAEEENVL